MENLLTRAGTYRSLTITFNTPLLIAVIEVAIAFIIFHIAAAVVPASSLFSSALSFLAFVFLALALIYAACQLYWQTTSAGLDQQAILSLCASALLGSFLISLIILAFVTIDPSNILSSALDIALCVFSLAGLLFFRMPEAPLPAQQTRRAVPIVVGAEPLPLVNNGILPEAVNPVPAIPFPSEKMQEFLQDFLNYTPPPSIARFLSVSKNNEHISYNEDACFMSTSKKGACFALCDGASNSELPRGWAILLGRKWCFEPINPTDEKRGVDAQKMMNWLAEPRLQWNQWVKYIWPFDTDPYNQRRKQALISDEKVLSILERGALATFLGLEIDRKNTQWCALAIGDTCLFLVKQLNTPAPHLIPIMPLTSSALFNSQPPLLSSHLDENIGYLLPHFVYRQEHYDPGDILLMATDALARWLTFQAEKGETDWQILLDIRDQQRFATFIQQRRGKKSNQIEPDDTTLVVIHL